MIKIPKRLGVTNITDCVTHYRMGNHVHMLLKIGLEPLEQMMARLCGSYVYWYNRKYQRVGNLFQDRFKGEAIIDDQFKLCKDIYIRIQ